MVAATYLIGQLCSVVIYQEFVNNFFFFCNNEVENTLIELSTEVFDLADQFHHLHGEPCNRLVHRDNNVPLRPH